MLYRYILYIIYYIDIYYIIHSKNCRAYNSFTSVASDRRIISVNIRLSLRANNKTSSKIKHYYSTRLKTDTETRFTFITKVNTEFEALHDTMYGYSFAIY